MYKSGSGSCISSSGIICPQLVVIRKGESCETHRERQPDDVPVPVSPLLEMLPSRNRDCQAALQPEGAAQGGWTKPHLGRLLRQCGPHSEARLGTKMKGPATHRLLIVLRMPGPCQAKKVTHPLAMYKQLVHHTEALRLKLHHDHHKECREG